MAHPLYQDPEPSEAKRRRQRLTKQVIQGNYPTYFNTAKCLAVFQLSLKDKPLKAFTVFVLFFAAHLCTVRPG